MEEAGICDPWEAVTREIIVFVEPRLEFKHFSLVFAEVFAHLNININLSANSKLFIASLITISLFFDSEPWMTLNMPANHVIEHLESLSSF